MCFPFVYLMTLVCLLTEYTSLNSWHSLLSSQGNIFTAVLTFSQTWALSLSAEFLTNFVHGIHMQMDAVQLRHF
jgi:hypothetical protein